MATPVNWLLLVLFLAVLDLSATAKPETDGDETAGHETAGHETARPKTARRKTAGPKTAIPKTARPKTNGPKTARPKTARPKTDGPKTAGPKKGLEGVKTSTLSAEEQAVVDKISTELAGFAQASGSEINTAAADPKVLKHLHKFQKNLARLCISGYVLRYVAADPKANKPGKAAKAAKAAMDTANGCAAMLGS